MLPIFILFRARVFSVRCVFVVIPDLHVFEDQCLFRVKFFYSLFCKTML